MTAALSAIQFQPSEGDNVRRPKLQKVLDHLVAVELVTLDDVIAALASAASPVANQVAYWTSPTAAAFTTLSPFARTFVDDADAATVRTTIGAEGSIAAGTSGQYWRGDKSWQTLDKTAVGLGSVDNTADNAKVVLSAATFTTSRNIDGQAFNGSANITVIAPGTHAAASKATPVDADELPLVDSAASNVLAKLTWANLKATLKTYLDTLYQSIQTTGTFTPTITFGGAGVGITYAAQNGRYTKTGRQVTATIRVALSAKGSSVGNLDIVGLPFTSNSAVPYAIGNLLMNAITGMNTPMGLILNSATTVAVYNQSGTGFARMTDANCTNTTDLYISVTYDT